MGNFVRPAFSDNVDLEHRGLLAGVVPSRSVNISEQNVCTKPRTAFHT